MIKVLVLAFCVFFHVSSASNGTNLLKQHEEELIERTRLIWKNALQEEFVYFSEQSLVEDMNFPSLADFRSYYLLRKNFSETRDMVVDKMIENKFRPFDFKFCGYGGEGVTDKLSHASYPKPKYSEGVAILNALDVFYWKHVTNKHVFCPWNPF